MGLFQRFREAYSKEAIEDSAKKAWRWTKIGVATLGVLVILVIRRWLPQIFSDGLLVQPGAAGVPVRGHQEERRLQTSATGFL